ncbi:carboxypeptidase-like regulatory domain-containing protein [Maribacter sp.]|uniref:carboxypeptidase-like regulatory domain-containing protein n=1 Tax=Maribacter sp. TaxID=1897614 RepID=UPI0025BFEC5F|nr:carboxypeptidase-like regulatory domain-containing protein [Maribacter sp.]
MEKITFWLLSIVITTIFSSTQAQTLTATVVDSTSQKPIPYVTVKLKNKGVITNEEGRFSFLLNNEIKATDSLFISCIGYATLGKPINEFQENTIYLQPMAIELNPVIVSNKQYTAEEIIDMVEDNLEKNYNSNLSKKRLFFRDSYYQSFNKMDYTFVKSTIDAFNKNFLDSVLNSVPKRSSYYTEVLCDLYGNNEEDNQKMELIKASELYDKSKQLDFTNLEDRFNEIVRKNVKPNSYFKIKSGLFGTKVDGEDFDEIFETEVDSSDAAALKKEIEKKKKEEIDRKANFSKYRRNSLARMMQNLFYMEDSKLNFIHKSRKYNFTLKEFTYIGDDAIYIVDFKSKGSADYSGQLYINSDDFAIIRVDYENIKSLKKFSLLGLNMNRYLDKGKMFFIKEENGKYNLRYLEEEEGTRVGIKRPLKIIEKNKHVKGRNKQNELSLKLDIATTGINKHEVIVFNSENITQAAYDAYTENNTVLPKYMPNYNPEFWKGYTIIEPNQAIREFTSDDVSIE